MKQRILNAVDWVVDFFTLGQYGVEEWPEVDDSEDPTDWCDWAWIG